MGSARQMAEMLRSCSTQSDQMPVEMTLEREFGISYETAGSRSRWTEWCAKGCERVTESGNDPLKSLLIGASLGSVPDGACGLDRFRPLTTG